MTVTDPGPAVHAPARMRVRKRNGDAEPVDVSKIVRAVERCADGLGEVDEITKRIFDALDVIPES